MRYIRQADAHIRQLEDIDMKDKENQITEMGICIDELQAEIEELMGINENMIQVELAEKQKVIDNFQEEIDRQRQQLTLLLTS